MYKGGGTCVSVFTLHIDTRNWSDPSGQNSSDLSLRVFLLHSSSGLHRARASPDFLVNCSSSSETAYCCWLLPKTPYMQQHITRVKEVEATVSWKAADNRCRTWAASCQEQHGFGKNAPTVISSSSGSFWFRSAMLKLAEGSNLSE